MVNAADAALARDGFRLRGKTGSHEARFAYPGLPPEFVKLRRLITVARRMRNTAQYDTADAVPERVAQEAIAAADGLISAVEATI